MTELAKFAVLKATKHVLFIIQLVEVERTIKRIRVNFNLLKLLASFW